MLLLCWSAGAADSRASADFRKDIQPLLKEYCYDCHGDGANKGGVAFDEFKSDQALLENHDLWWNVLKYTRAGIMPPDKKPRPTSEQQARLANWIKYGVFRIDPKNPDPGRVTVRRLNRNEYRNTIRDLMGIDFHAEAEFPPDDTGYGFDNIGDVLTLSPMLLEKYLGAARAIVNEAVPTVSRVIPEQIIAGSRFRTNSIGAMLGGGRNRPDTFISLPYDEPAKLSSSFRAKQAGKYEVIVEVVARGAFNFDPGTCNMTFKADDKELLKQEFAWQDGKNYRLKSEQEWTPGDHALTFELQPGKPTEREANRIQLRLISVTVRGPMDPQYWAKPPNYERFFTRDVPEKPDARRQYAREVLNNFAKKAYRRPVEAAVVDRLVNLSESIYSQPGKTFEFGIAQAMAAMLASPRFLFRMEEIESSPAAKGASIASVDEYSLASRLSYFLWSTMPDDELFGLAERGELRKNLPAQVKRMLADARSEALVENFTGQWLQTRDVDGIIINAREVLARDAGTEKEMREQQAAFQAALAARPQGARGGLTNLLGGTNGMAGSTNLSGTNLFARGNRGFNGFRNRFTQPRIQLDNDIRAAMKKETQMAFSTVMREDRSISELIESDYTFLNQKLAAYYGLTNLNVTGTEMRRVTLPPDSPRGGILTDGSVLVVTSNPDRTSPVKRGLFILSNVLGTPAPPPPGNVPALEVAEKDIKDHEPTLRESLALHREKPLCASCHSRMDPLGLAFENFNALGSWRDSERKQPIEAGGKLITGESFKNVHELKHLLVTQRRGDFYRCLTEKLLTYALGRGLEYYDSETVDRILQQLEQNDGRLQTLLTSIIDSAPFQKARTEANAVTADSDEPSKSPGETKQLAKNPK